MSKTLYKITTEKYGEWWVIATNGQVYAPRLVAAMQC